MLWVRRIFYNLKNYGLLLLSITKETRAETLHEAIAQWYSAARALSSGKTDVLQFVRLGTANLKLDFALGWKFGANPVLVRGVPLVD
jgi:hypothetical protein